MTKNQKYNLILIIIFIVGTILRILWISLIPTEPVSDSLFYHLTASSIAEGKGYQYEGKPTAYWPVGYPAILGTLYAIGGNNIIIAKIANVIFSFGIMLLSYKISIQFFKSKVVGAVTLGLASFYINHIVYCSLLFSELSFLFFLMLAIFVFLKFDSKSSRVLSGILWGIACLIKPIIFLLPIVVILSTNKNVSRKTLNAISIVYIAIMITIFPWLWRNFKVFDHFVFISNNGGINLLIGNNPYATGEYLWNEKISHLPGIIDKEYERNLAAQKYALSYMSEHPLRTIELAWLKFYHLYKSDLDGLYLNQNALTSNLNQCYHFLFKSLRRYAIIYYWLIIFSFLLLITNSLLKNKFNIPKLGIIITVYFTICYMIFFGNMRFHFPMMPWLMMYSGLMAEKIFFQKLK